MRLVMMLLLGFVLGGCGSKGPQPVKLVDFKPSAKLSFAWKVNIGDAGRYIFTPAISGDSVFAAGNRGDLLRINAANGKIVVIREMGVLRMFVKEKGKWRVAGAGLVPIVSQ